MAQTTVNHPPRISAIKDQRVNLTAQTPFQEQFFTISDEHLNNCTVGYISSNPTYTHDQLGMVIEPCTGQANCPASDGSTTGYHVKFNDNLRFGSNHAVVTVTVYDNDNAHGALDASTSFTLRQDSADHPPTIAGIASEQIQLSDKVKGYSPVQFVIGDEDTNGVDDMDAGDGTPTLMGTPDATV